MSRAPTRRFSREDIQDKIRDLSLEIDDNRTDALVRLSLIQQRIRYRNILKKFR